MAKNKILVTGSAGLIGSSLVKFLCEKDLEINSIDRNKNIFKNKKHFFFEKSLKIFFKKNKRKFDVIIHAAALSKNKFSRTIPEKLINKNIEDLLFILKNIKSSKNTRLIFISSNQIIDDLNNYGFLQPYSLSKKVGEDILRYYSYRYNIPVSVIRLPDVYTSDKRKNKDSLLKIIKKLSTNKTIFIENIKHTFNFVNIFDVCNLIYSIINRRKSNKFTLHLVKGNKKINLLNLVKYLKIKLNSKSKIKIKIIKENKNKNYKVSKIKFLSYTKKFDYEIQNVLLGYKKLLYRKFT